MRWAAISLCAGQMLAMCAAQAAFAFDYIGQFQPGDYPDDLAAEMQKHRCKMTETAMYDLVKGKGGEINGAQATALNMAKAGQLVWDKKDTCTLVGLGKCR